MGGVFRSRFVTCHQRHNGACLSDFARNPLQLFVLVKRRASDPRPPPVPASYQVLRVEDWTSYWLARKSIEESKASGTRLAIDIVESEFYDLFRDLEVLGEGLTAVVQTTPLSELKEALRFVEPGAMLPAEYTDDLVVDSGVLDRLASLEVNFKTAKAANPGGASEEWIRVAVLSTAVGLPLASPSGR